MYIYLNLILIIRSYDRDRYRIYTIPWDRNIIRIVIDIFGYPYLRTVNNINIRPYIYTIPWDRLIINIIINSLRVN